MEFLPYYKTKNVHAKNQNVIKITVNVFELGQDVHRNANVFRVKMENTSIKICLISRWRLK